MTSTRRRRILAAILCTTLVLGCGSRADTTRTSIRDFASAGGIELEHYASFDEMNGNSDLTIVGMVSRVEFGPDESGLRTARALVRSAGSEKSIEVAFLLGGADSADQTLSSLRTEMPKGQAIWLLRSIPVYPGVYRPVNQAAIVERAPNGRGQPAFYRGSADAIRRNVEHEGMDHVAFIKNLNDLEFDSLLMKMPK